MMQMQLSEIADRFAILILKWTHGGDVLDELLEYHNEFEPLAYGMGSAPAQFFALLRVNAEIWRLESAIRQGREDELGLAEVGRRALAIRDLNRERIRIKNTLAESVGDPKEVKIAHASQD